MLELEIGFRLKTAIVESVKTFKELMPHIGSALPVIELPQVKFDNLNNVSGVDLVATNMASACWVEGRTLSVRGFENYDKMEVGLFLNGELIDSGVGANVGGQAQALFWLIKHLQLRQLPLDAGALLITGKIGKINIAKEGKYTARYGGMDLSFTLMP